MLADWTHVGTAPKRNRADMSWASPISHQTGLRHSKAKPFRCATEFADCPRSP